MTVSNASQAPADTTQNEDPRTNISKGASSDFCQLQQLTGSARTEESLFNAIQKELSKGPGVLAVGICQHTEESSATIMFDNFHGPVFERSEFREVVTQSATEAFRNGQPIVAPVPSVRNLFVHSFPVRAEERVIRSLSVATTASQTESMEARMAAVVSLISLWHERQHFAVTREHLKVAAAVLELTGGIQGARTFRSGCVTLVNTLREYFGCNSVVLGTATRNGSMKISAVSGVPDFDARSDLAEQMLDAVHECDTRDRLSVYPADRYADRDSLLAHRRLAETLRVTRLTSHPVKTDAESSVGVLLISETQNSSKTDVSSFLSAACGPLAQSLMLSKQADRAIFARRNANVGSKTRLLRTACAIVVFAAVMLMPVADQIHCECSAEANRRSYVVAPHEGMIEQTFAEPGDVVTAGQLLAQMDDREIRWELAGLTAEYEKANKERDSALLAGDVAGSQKASMERQQLDARRNILQQRLNQLNIVAPCDGLVLEAHLDRVTHAPVTIGQALYEVAPLDPITVEVAVADSDYRRVQIGDQVTVRLDGSVQPYEGTLQRIHPQSELVEQQNVFVAEIVLANTDQTLQPGMKGYARITGRQVSLGWRLFHRPWEHFRRSLPF